MTLSPNSIINWVIAALIILGLTHVGLYVASLYLRFKSGEREKTEQLIRTLADDISAGLLRLWLFARPIMQLIVILFVAYWFGQAIGFSKEQIAALSTLDIKTVLAFFVIAAFCLAAFLSENPATWLKDLALVVIGFYFGTRVGP